MVRCPLGGILSWAFQFLKGFEMLGHDIFYFEKADYENACYNPVDDRLEDDCTVGIQCVSDLLKTYGLGDQWAFIDHSKQCFGMSEAALQEVFRTADIFIDMGAHGSWAEEAKHVPVRVLLEGEPGYTQMIMEHKRKAGEHLTDYDLYYSVGRQIGTAASFAPDAGQSWGHLWPVVVTDLFSASPTPTNAPFTTVMTWQSHTPIEYDGVTYGQKDIEFEKFINLPKRVDASLELRVSGRAIPRQRLVKHGWRIPETKTITQSVKDYYTYIRQSAGEFSVAKSVFVKTQSGWFGDRSGTYLASGRPVVLQDTGFSNHLPCGKGLFAVNNEDEAADAIGQIKADYKEHSEAARQIAKEYLDAERCLKKFVSEIS
jgi:hypothetical protein